MSGRRGFMAFLGGLAFTGAAVKVEAATKPTLILPPKLMAASCLPTAFPLLAQHDTQMHAILHVGINVPKDHFKAWLEAGLRMTEAHGGRK